MARLARFSMTAKLESCWMIPPPRQSPTLSLRLENQPIETEGRTRHGLRLAGDRYGLGASAKRLVELLEEFCKVSRFAGNRFGAPASW